MPSLKAFTVSSARPLPVILLADVSGSMAADGKIDALNGAVAEMQAALAEEEDERAEIHLAVVTFGGTATFHVPLTPANDVRWTPIRADGGRRWALRWTSPPISSRTATGCRAGPTGPPSCW